ncbi:dehydrogenase/reductase SDR family member on chromosome X [Callorhinchus milii]|uniref:Polyprenol dehydrogenase n=1 Tax=Callorhinchus milii TaxID=7868 RepID=K4FSP2_CALMI|nr:dehydrogenase/reductase SDR family member on chromosome X [Callorhinchus milii]AFK11093.1 dehydrogenase/reductase (SDR family) X-linked [Callorhinchus milii]
MAAVSVAVAALRVYAAGLRLLFLQLLPRNRSPGSAAYPPQNGKVAIVTGGAKGIGYETAKQLSRLGMRVIIAVNDERSGQESVKRIVQETGNQKVEYMGLDLASLRSVRQFVQRFKAKNLPLHVLVNNAAVMLVPQSSTEDGFEEHFGVNYLGHFLLTYLLLETLRQSGKEDCNARVVTLSSTTHYVGELNLNDLQSRSCYSPHGAYAQSKLALVLFTYQLQQHLTAERSHITANAVDPGIVNTDLYRHTNWLFKLCKWLSAWLLFKTPAQGATTVVHAALAPELEGVGSCYLASGQKTNSSDVSYDAELQSQLWTLSCKLLSIPGTGGLTSQTSESIHPT